METKKMAQSTGGLDGVVVADTRLSEVDGERGRLIIAGHDIVFLGERGQRAMELLREYPFTV